MQILTKPLFIIISVICLGSLFATTELQAANECKIKYQYNSGSGTNIKRHTKYLTLSAGQTKTLNRSRMDYVKNIKDNKVKLSNRNMLTNQPYTYELSKNAKDPAVGNHLVNVKLQKVTCLKAPATPADIVAKQMKQAGKTAGEIALFLRNSLRVPDVDISKFLKQAGFPIGEVAKAMKILNKNATAAGNYLKAAFNPSMRTMARALKVAQYRVDQIAKALHQIFDKPAKDIKPILQGIGYTAAQAGSAVAGFAAEVEDSGVSISTINEKRMPDARVNISVNHGSTQGFLRITGEGLKDITGVAGLPVRNAIIHRKKSTIMNLVKNFPSASSGNDTYLLIELHFRNPAGRWSGATSGRGYLKTKNGRKLTDSEFRWNILEAAAPKKCPKGKRLVKGVCR